MARALSKKTRFEIFKRDKFQCQYCGKTPPAVVLEVDHIVAVAEGGSHDPTNLITACFDCNRGKGSAPLSVSPEAQEGRLERLQERIEQAEAYEAMLLARRTSEDEAIEAIVGVYEGAYEGWTLLDSARVSIRRFLRLLPKIQVQEAMEIACSRKDKDRAFRYFCGVCWRKLDR